MQILNRSNIISGVLAVAVLAVVVVSSSCKSARNISSALSKKDSATLIVDPLKSDSARRVRSAVEKIQGNQINFETFSSKVKINYAGKEKKYNDINAFLRMKKDSVIWVSINAVLGIEAFRVMITPDEVNVIDKLNRTVQTHKFEYLQEVTQLPIDFKALQSLIIGNPVFLDSNIVAYGESETTVTLTTLGDLFKNFSTFIAPNMYLQRSKLDDADVVKNRSADLFYDEYEMNGPRAFSGRRKISIADKNRTDIDLEFRQVVFDTPLNYPFSIPDGYKRKEMR